MQGPVNLILLAGGALALLRILLGARRSRRRRRRSEFYNSYLHSTLWRKRRLEWIASTEGRCEKCPPWRHPTRLEVHHKHYRTLGHERRQDVQVLCPRHHLKADRRRRRKRLF